MTILVTGGTLKLRNDIIQESTGFAQAAIEIEGGDHGFKGVGEQGGFAAAAALFFAPAEAQVRAEVDARGYLAKVAAADEGGAKAGQLALA